MKLQLTLPAALQSAMTRFDAMSLRERVLIGTALLASLLVVWDTALMQPLNVRRAALMTILDTDPNAIQTDSLQAAVGTADSPVTTDGGTATDPDPVGTALLERESLRIHIADINKQLQQVSAELIAPERMSEVLYDVLHQQHGVTLISLHNKPVSSLVPVQPHPNSDPRAEPSTVAAGTQQLGPGPYLHPVELVIEGRYLDILDYLRALEALPWHFDWQSLELDSSHYPLNRARIQISTLSLDPAWIGT